MTLSRKLILSVDDNEDILEFIELTLEGQDFILHKTTEADTAIALVEKHSYFCIILDIILANNTTSDRIVDFIVHNSGHSNNQTPLIIISGFIDQNYADKIKRKCKAIKEVLLKPFTSEELLEAINRPMAEPSVILPSSTPFNVIVHGSKEIINDENILIKGEKEEDFNKMTLVAGSKEAEMDEITKIAGSGQEKNSENDGPNITGTVTTVIPREELDFGQLILNLEAGHLDIEKNSNNNLSSTDKKTEEVITFLRENINFRNAKGETMLMLLCARGAMSAIKALIEKNANIGLMSKFGKTCLHYATKSNNPELIPYLIGLGAKINAKDSSMQEPMFDAVVNGNAMAVDILLKNGARITNKVKGRTYLMYAATYGHEAVVKRLLVAGIDCHTKDINGNTALDLAIKKEHQAIIDLLEPLSS